MEEDLSKYAYLDTKHAVLMDFDEFNGIMPKKYYFILMKENYCYTDITQISKGYSDAIKDIKDRYGVDLST